MKHILCLIIATICPLLICADESPIEFSIDQDGKHWKLAYDGGVNDFSIKEYIPEEEKLENWTHLISVVTYEGWSQEPKVVFESIIDNIQTRLPHAKVAFRVHDEQKETIMAEWNVQGDGLAEEEHNWIKIFTENNKIHTLLYTTKNLKEVETVRNDWERIIRDSSLKK